MAYSMIPSMASRYSASYASQYGFQRNIDSLTGKLRVGGSGNVTVQPDTAEVRLGVSTESKQLKVAQKENAEITNQMILALKQLGVSSKDIQTQSYTIDSQYDYIEGQKIFRGYRVFHQLKIVVRDLGKIGEIIDQAVEKGANEVSRINFFLSDSSKYYQQALEKAVEDTLKKSRMLGEKYKIAVSKVPVQIIEQSNYAGAQAEPLLFQAAEAGTPIQQGQIEINAQVEAVFLYTPAHNSGDVYTG